MHFHSPAHTAKLCHHPLDDVTRHTGMPCHGRGHQGIGHIVLAKQSWARGKNQRNLLARRVHAEVERHRITFLSCNVIHCRVGRFGRIDHREALNCWLTVHFRPLESSREKKGVLNLASKLLKRDPKGLFRSVNVEVVRFEVRDRCDGGVEVMEASVEFIGLDDVPSGTRSGDVVAARG